MNETNDELSPAFDELPSSEQTRIKTNLETGLFHLKLAIEAFEGVGDETDISDLQDFADEAEDAIKYIEGILDE